MIYLPLIICLIGLAIYLLIDPALRNGRLLEVGKIMFWVGLLAWLLGGAKV